MGIASNMTTYQTCLAVEEPPFEVDGIPVPREVHRTDGSGSGFTLCGRAVESLVAESTPVAQCAYCLETNISGTMGVIHERQPAIPMFEESVE
jgi:hypothetical protein